MVKYLLKKLVEERSASIFDVCYINLLIYHFSFSIYYCRFKLPSAVFLLQYSFTTTHLCCVVIVKYILL